METDSELLRCFVIHRSERAFTELVRRHAGVVHRAALRQLGGNEALAQDITQQAFVTLAMKAPVLLHHTVLAAWLYTTTHHLVRNTRRAEWRRHTRENEARAMNEVMQTTDSRNPDWQSMRAMLDDMLLKLDVPDREAIVLRFLSGNPFSAVGTALHISEDAARKRVERALERMREAFAKRGITTTAHALTAMLGAEAIAAPPALITSIAANALTLAAVAGASATGMASIGLMTATKLAAAAIALGAIGIVWHQHGSIRALQTELEFAHQKRTALEAQLAEAAARRATIEPQTTPPAQAFPALDSTTQYAITIADRVAELKQLLARRPDQQIPELRLIPDAGWVAAASRTASNDDELRQIFHQLRNYGKAGFALMAPKALEKFAESHDGELPTDIMQLAPYFAPPLDAAILQRYRMIRSGPYSEMPNNEPLIGEIAPVDANYDSVTRITKYSSSITNVDSVGSAIEYAVDAFARANNGRRPEEAAQLTPFLAKPIEPAALQRYWSRLVLRQSGRSQRQPPP